MQEKEVTASTTTPFGKYRGEPLSVLLADHDYCQWVLTQAGIQERYPEVFTFLLQGEQPAQTPAHNALQARFLERDFCDSVVRAIRSGVTAQCCDHGVDDPPAEAWDYHFGQRFLKRSPHTRGAGKVVFEQSGWDVLLYMVYECQVCGVRAENRFPIAIELKPTLSDDYPAVIRQVRTAVSVAEARKVKIGSLVVIAGEFTSRAVTIEQAKAIYRASGIHLLLLADVEPLV